MGKRETEAAEADSQLEAMGQSGRASLPAVQWNKEKTHNEKKHSGTKNEPSQQNNQGF